MLVDDVRKTLADADVNQPLLDRTEYGDFCKVVKEVLEKYLAVEESGTTATTDAARKKLADAVEGEFTKLLTGLLKEADAQPDEAETRKKLSTVIDDFFSKAKRNRKTE